MSPSTFLSALSKSDAKRVHPFLNIADQENSTGAVECADGLSNPSVQRLTASLDVILSAYSNIQSLAKSKSKWVNDAGLEDIVKLLDMCNAISDNIADVKHYQTLLQSAIHCLDHRGIEINKLSQTTLVRATNMLANCKHAINNANAKCNNSTSRSREIVYIKEVICSPSYSRLSRSDSDLSGDMGNLKVCTASVLRTVAKALSLELPRETFHGQGDTRVLAGRCSRLRSLFERVRNHNRSKGSRFLLYELVTADVLVRKLYDLLVGKQQKARKEPADQVKELVDALKKYMADLDEGIAPLDSKIKELYSALITIRVTLLDTLTYNA